MSMPRATRSRTIWRHLSGVTLRDAMPTAECRAVSATSVVAVKSAPWSNRNSTTRSNPSGRRCLMEHRNAPKCPSIDICPVSDKDLHHTDVVCVSGVRDTTGSNDRGKEGCVLKAITHLYPGTTSKKQNNVLFFTESGGAVQSSFAKRTPPMNVCPVFEAQQKVENRWRGEDRSDLKGLRLGEYSGSELFSLLSQTTQEKTQNLKLDQGWQGAHNTQDSTRTNNHVSESRSMGHLHTHPSPCLQQNPNCKHTAPLNSHHQCRVPLHQTVQVCPHAQEEPEVIDIPSVQKGQQRRTELLSRCAPERPNHLPDIATQKRRQTRHLPALRRWSRSTKEPRGHRENGCHGVEGKHRVHDRGWEREGGHWRERRGGKGHRRTHGVGVEGERDPGTGLEEGGPKGLRLSFHPGSPSQSVGRSTQLVLLTPSSGRHRNTAGMHTDLVGGA
mmetsp:Transcript_6322/g.12524  ORF Transcript_6322/g.12524 Transcript_6322/m.12524 type:complete len:443 (-) Transcript_6322:246-1574(-)